MSEEIELPIIVIHSSSYNYCQLPDSLSLSTSVPESVCAAPPLLGYQLLWPGQSAPFVSPWRPTSGTSSSPSPARASHSHSRSHLILYTDQKVDSNLHNGVIVKLLPILTAKTPSELYLQPKSEYDWEIVSTNATFIEQNLLRSLSLLYVGQTLCINISSSLTAELIVKSAKYDGEDSLTVSHRESIANSSDEESINSLEIVRLTLDTRLIVEPYVDKETKDKLTNELLLADACTTSDFYPLQVLPSVFRGVDSSYFGNSNSVSDSAGNRSVTNYTSSNCSNSHRVVDNCLFELLQSENDLQQLPKITDKHQLLDDDVTCYVHPLFLLCALEMALLAHESSCYSGKTVEEKSFIAILDLSESTSVTISDSNSEDVPVIDMRNNNNVNTDNLPKTQSDSLKQSACVVVVRANRAIRPFHVLLPELIRKRCSIEDHSFVRLRLVNSVDDKPCRIPKLLQLFPVEWSDESSAASSSDHATPLVKTNNILDATDGQLDMARIAFANRIEKLGNSVCCHPLVLIDQQLLSIPTNTSFGNFRSVECLNFQLELGVQRRSERSKKTVSLRSGEKFPLPDVVVIQQENISDFLDQCMECIAVCPSVVTINLPRDKALTKSVSTVAPTSDSCFKHIAGTETTLQLILEKLLAHLLPTAIYDQVKSNLCGTSPIVLLCGKHGSGKSLICRQVSQLLSNCPRTLTEVVRVNCAQLSLSPLEDVLEKLNNTFQGNFGKTRTPRLAVLDDLDYLCPGISSDAIVSGRGTIADERSMIIALHLQRLLQDISTRHRESISAAKNLFTESEVGATEDKGSRNSKSKYCNFFELYLEDRIVAKVLSSVTAVLITSNTVDSLPTSLFSTSLIDCAVSVQSLLPKTRLELLPKLLLQHYRIDFAVETLSARQQHLLIDQTEGMLIADILSVVRQFALKNYQLIDNAVVDTSGYPESEVVVVKAGVHEASSVEEKDYNPREQGIFEALIQLLRAKGLRTVNSKTKAHATKDSNLTFKDIGGYDDVKRSILQIIRMPAIYQRLYNFSPVRRQRAILLYGPPGGGKTMMGKAAGAEFGSNFYCVRGPELLDKYIGASEKAVRELFIQISDSGKPGLLFFDEFESLAPKRGKDNTGVTDRIVNQLLTFIDGVEATMSSSNNGSQVYIVAATSRPDLIDAALLRPGRIEKHIYIGLPTVEDRISIVKELLRTLNVAPGIDATIVEIAHHTKATLMTPADWKAVVSTAYLLATHEYINIHYSSLAETQESRLTYRKREHRSLEKHRDSDTFISDYRETYNEDISPNRKLSTPVVIIEENLMAAFHQTKPSISAQDLQFYSSIYQKFGGKAAAASSKSPTKVEDRNQQRMSFK